MNRTLRTLLVENSEDDALLLLEALRRDGYAPDFERVQTAAALRAALAAKEWDIILCDYLMPSFDAPAALRIVQELKPELPVIVVSGTVGEDTAVETIKLGATDYLMKDRLVRLGRSVAQALEQKRLRRERRQTDQALQESVAKLHGILRAAPVGLGRVVNRVMVEVNEAMGEMMGYRPEELNGQETRLLYPTTEEYDAAGRHYVQLAQQNKVSFEARALRKDGRIIDASFTAVWLDATRPEAGVVFTAQDVSEHKRSEQERNRALSLMRATLESTADGILVVNQAGKIETYNRLFAEMWRLTDDVLADQDDARAVADVLAQLSEPQIFLERIAYLYAHPLEESFDTLHFKDGRVYERYSRPQYIGGQAAGRVWSFRDITERRLTIEALRASEQRYRSLIEEARDAIFTLSTEGKIIGLNRAVEAITGWQPAGWIGRNFTEVLRPEDRAAAEARFAEVLRGERPPPFELQIPSRTGTMITLEFAVSPRLQHGEVVGVLGVGRDITERRLAEEARARLEGRLRQSQKIEAIGTLAGGIAHDFNNILSGIVGFNSLARQAAAGNAELLGHLDEIGRAGSRAADLVRQILAFSRAGDLTMVPVELRPIIAEAVQLLRATIPTSIDFEINLDSNLPAVLGNATQLHQIVMNLGTNAWHAMRDQPGRLRLSLEACVVDDELARGLSDIGAGMFLRITVSDTGCGIDPATQERVFEPFFTTKGQGEGTGLGLSVVHGIVRSHHGAIRLTSAVGRGSTFEIYLPAISALALPASAEPGLIPRGNGERILFVDDEMPIVRLGERMLQQIGYVAVGECQVLEALARFERDPGAFHMVITDQTMPGLTGLEFAARIHALRADLPVVLTSGYSVALTPERIQTSGIREIIAKPFGLQTLAATVHRHLLCPPQA